MFRILKLALDHETFEFQIEAEEYDPASFTWNVSDEKPFTISPATLAGVN